MSRRAAIYIRTSSEKQGEKFSPLEQEADCRRLAQEKGLDVVHVFRDVEKYRVGNKLVEPSGVAQIALPCSPCSKTPPEINSMSSLPGVRIDCIVEYERC